MRFLTLMWKEFRESLPWLLIAAIAFIAIGSFILRIEVQNRMLEWRYWNFNPGQPVNVYGLFCFTNLSLTGTWLFLISIALGLALGVRQFWMAHFTKTWGFELHRSVSRSTILSAKLCSTLLGFCMSIGLVWTIFYHYASQQGLFLIPPPTRIFIEGWVLMAMGFVAYLGTALIGLSRARWYTTKVFGLAFAVLVLLSSLHWNLSWVFMALIIGAIILLSQITYAFCKREF